MTPIELQLLLILVKGFGLCVVFFALARVLLAGRSAQAVSLYWRSALAGLMIVPLVSLWLPWWSISVPGQARGSSVVASQPAPSDPVATARPDTVVVVPLREEVVEVLEASRVPEFEVPPAIVATPFRSAWQPRLLPGIWMLGVVLVLGRWAGSWVRVSRLMRSGTRVRSAEWERDLARFSAGHSRVRLVISEAVTSPIVFGLWRPVLLLPSDAGSWDGEQRRAVLAHELCHVRRRDALFLLLACVTAAVHWINPLAWLAAKRLRLAEERTADDAVLEDGRDPAEYASLLAGFARRGVAGMERLPAVAPSMASPSTVRSRVQRILDGGQRRGAPQRITRLVFGVLVGAAVLIGGGVSFGPAAAREIPAKPADGGEEPAKDEDLSESSGGKILFKAREIIVPAVDFDQTTLEEAIDYLRLRSRELDTVERDPQKKGFNFVVIGEETAGRVIPRLQLRNVPLATVLEFICQQTETTYEAGPFAITIKDAKGVEPAPVPGVKHLPPAEALIVEKLRRIILPTVKLEDASLNDALAYLRQRARELDGAEPDPGKKGLNIVLRGKDLGARKIRMLSLIKVPLATVLKYVCDETRTAYEVNPFGITIVDAMDRSASDLVLRTFAVPPNFPEELRNMVDGGSEVDPFAADVASKVKLRPVLELLRDRGIDFAEGASVSYAAETSRLVVRAREENLDLMAQLIDQLMRNLHTMIKLRIELYEVPKAEALKIVKENAARNEGSDAYRMVEALVAQKSAKLLSSPSTMVRSGQRGRLKSGSELAYVAAYQEKDGRDLPVERKVLVGSSIELDAVMGRDEQVLDVRYGLTMTRGEPKIVRRKIKAPASGREVEVETVYIDTLTLSQGLTTLSGQTQLLGMMQSSMSVENPNEIMAFLTATVTKVMR